MRELEIVSNSGNTASMKDTHRGDMVRFTRRAVGMSREDFTASFPPNAILGATLLPDWKYQIHVGKYLEYRQVFKRVRQPDRPASLAHGQPSALAAYLL